MTAGQSALRRFAPIAILAIVYYGAARLGLQLAFAGSNVTPVWPASGIAFAALFLCGVRLWPAVLAGAFAANLAGFAHNNLGPDWHSALVSGAMAVGNTLEAVTGALLFARVAGREKPLAQIQNVHRFALVATLVCASAAAIGTAALVLGAIVPRALQWTVVSTWWLGDVAGVLIVAPVLVAWSGQRRFTWSPRLLAEAALSLALLAGILLLVFSAQYGAGGATRWIAYLLLPAVGWAAYRHGTRGASLACVIIAAAAVVSTINGAGPLAGGTLNDTLLTVQTFVALTSLVGLVLCADMSELRRRRAVGRMPQRIAAHWSTLFACMALTVFVWHMVASDTERRARAGFDAEVLKISDRIQERMGTYEQGLVSARALFAASTTVDRQDWHDFIAGMGMAANYPGIEGIGYAALVKRGGKQALVERVRAEGFPTFHIRPEGERDEYMAIIYLEPFSLRNQKAFGFDMMSEPTRRAAIERARESGEPTLSGVVALVQEGERGRQPGFLMYMPVFARGALSATREQRMASMQGVVYSPFRVNDLMAGMFANAGDDVVSLEIFDGAGTAPAARMFSSTERSQGQRAAYPNPLVATALVPLQAHQWNIRVTSLPAFEQRIDRQKAHIALIAGTIISLLFFALVRGLTARQEYAAALAADMRAALDQSERKFESLVDSAIEFSIIATGLDGDIRVFSTGAQRLLGYRAQDMLGTHQLARLHTPEELAARGAALSAELGYAVAGFEVIVAMARRGATEAREWTYVHQDGTRIPVNLVVTAIRDNVGEINGFLGVAHDITRQKFLQASLVAAKDQAEAASQAKSDFVANMSHEIRTPMNAVLGVTHLLGRTNLSVDQRKYVDMIGSAGQTLLGILNDVLDFSKIEAGRLELAPSAFGLDEVIDTLASIMTAYCGEKELELAIGVMPDVPRALVGDAMRLQQVLSNLVSNAIKFTDHGEVSVLVELDRRDGDRAQLCFTVSDSGIGMDSDLLARLFSPFTQADASMTRRFGGTGLGLTISLRLTQLMGGTIEVDSGSGKGSRFRLSVPLTVGAAPAAQGAAAPAPLRVLVVDDNATSRRFLGLTLSGWHWRHDAAASGMEALACIDKLRAQGERYDAVLVDWQMPGMDGLATMRAMRGFMAGKTLPVLVMAGACARARLIQEPATAEANAILLKPVTASSLRAAVEDILAPAGRSGAHGAPAPANEGRIRLDGVRILLVEDNELNQFVAVGILRQAGALVEVAGNGREALERLAQPGGFDLILMDVQMPVMDGLSATRAIRNSLGLRLPVVAMSAGVMPSERSDCMAAGMNDFIAKPLDVDDMFKVIARFLPGRMRAATAPAAAVVPASGVFDAEALLALSRNNPEQRAALIGVLSKMLRNAPLEMRSAREAMEQGRLEDARRVLHTLRGSVGIVNAKRFVAACLALEAALREARPAAEMAALLEQAESEFDATISVGTSWISQHVPQV